MVICPQDLSTEALAGVLEEFITREGTDYGENELSLEEKVDRLKKQVLSGEVLMVFDERLQAVNLVDKRDYDQSKRDDGGKD